MYWKDDDQNIQSKQIIEKSVKINGKAQIEFDLKNDLEINDQFAKYDRNLYLEAIVEEELTGDFFYSFFYP